MLTFAGFIDGFQIILSLIPFVGWFISSVVGFFASIVLGLMFSHFGMSVMNPKNVLGFLGTLIGEIIPIVDLLPLWSMMTFTMIVSNRRATRSGTTS